MLNIKNPETYRLARTLAERRGDCFPYALAKGTGEPLLFKGDGFSQTDIVSAV